MRLFGRWQEIRSEASSVTNAYGLSDTHDDRRSYRAENRGGGNAGLMESEENMKPFPSLPTVLGNPAKNAGLPHSHRTTTTIEFGQFYFAAVATFQLCANKPGA
jgi:hypothetical protein